MWFTQRSRTLLSLASLASLASLVWLAGCDSSTSPKNQDGDSLSADEIRELFGYIMGGAQSAPPPNSNIAAHSQLMANATTPPVSYQVVLPCDAGGDQTIDVTGTLDMDEVAQTMTFVISNQVQTYNNCAFPISPQENFTIVSGSITTTGTVTAELANYPDIPEMISLNVHGVGSFVLNANNQTLQCNFDLTAVQNPNETEQHVNGTVCGMQVVDGIVQEP
jgi:hypothetical protein